MIKPTAKDAEIFIQLMTAQDTPRMQKAGEWFMTEFKAKDYKQFKKKYPRDSEGARYMGEILSSLEMAGTLVSHGLLNENLYFDASGIGFMWPRIEKIVLGMQKEMDPALWENAIWLAERQKKWKKEVWKPNQAWKK